MEEVGWLGRPTVRGLYSRSAANGTPRAALEATSFMQKRHFFWFEQLTPVWPGLRHAVRPWSSGESHLEVGCLSGTWLREMHRNPSIRVAANSDSVDWTVQTQKLVVPCSGWLVLEQGLHWMRMGAKTCVLLHGSRMT